MHASVTVSVFSVDGDGQGQQYSAAHGFSHRAAEFAVCRLIRCLPQKNAELPILLHLYLIQVFSGSFLILPFIKQ